ncbi:hypothetical protein [Plantactinospora endophytica]|uniref:Uncharacterized protein n=1 Tax=Plantactinospora endophytica TaxID=673535 RepID=A0ABQ4EDC1_9ACTN|nr:hypothetical protein [Plantactinospora endophytica]GIG92660.1 hypothetical protein Pen02_75960 [Plantactinospora endophytica]
MTTYAQLRAESWWGREIVTPEVAWLGTELCRRTGRPRGAFGSKGDNEHLRGAHRSQEWILNSRHCTDRTYTVQSGLTATQRRHVAGVDFTPGSDTQMIAQCRRIYAAVRAGRLEEVREFFGNVDGDRVVDGWDNVRDRTASSTRSHLWHWHLTLDRRHCADRSLMERILAIVLDDTLEEDDMPLTNADAKLVARAVVSQKLGSSGPTVQVALQEAASLDSRLTALEAQLRATVAPVDVDALAAALKPHLTAAAVEAVRAALKVD